MFVIISLQPLVQTEAAVAVTASGRYERVQIDEILTNGTFKDTVQCFFRYDVIGFEAHADDGYVPYRTVYTVT